MSRERHQHPIPHAQTHKIRPLRARQVSDQLMFAFQPDTYERAREEFHDDRLGRSLHIRSHFRAGTEPKARCR